MIGTIDSETDPFLVGRVPQPFAWGVYVPGGLGYVEYDYLAQWGDDCTDSIVQHLLQMPKTALYAHNGGKFDFHYLLPYVEEQEVTIINGRLAKMKIGEVTLVDSFLLIPFALEQYKKTKIDYAIFEADQREKPKNKKKILEYLHDDCVDLYELITGFHERVGKKLTIGEAAFSAMRKEGIEPPRLGRGHDERFRPFYYGGRCEAFKTGEFKRELQYIDINSAYPRAMMDEHPTGKKYDIYAGGNLLDELCGYEFVKLNCFSRGALPYRDHDGSLYFPNDDIPRNYNVTGWEIIAALKTNSIYGISNVTVYAPANIITFKPYVEKYYAEKKAAKKAGDRIGELVAKYLLNSGYGKFATDPEKFKKWYVAPLGIDYSDEYDDFEDIGEFTLWWRSDYKERGYYDVATAASITGWVRAYLWRSICNCEDVYYCDTDSIICANHSLPLSDNLGDWKLEALVSEARIAGKKLYSIKTPEGWKTASKGVRINERDMQQICQGGTVTHKSEAPTFSVKKGASFLERDVKMKVDKKA